MPYTAFFFAVFILFLKPDLLGDTISFLDRISAIRLTTAVALVFEAMTLILLIVQDRRYAYFGYHLNIPFTVILFAFIGIALIFLLIRDPLPDHIFFITMGAYIGTYLLSIMSFPLHPQRDPICFRSLYPDASRFWQE
jgi:hypothetical protein